MKKSITLLLLALCIKLSAQDTLAKAPFAKEVKISDELNYMKINLNKSHNQFIAGLCVYSVGGATAIMGVAMKKSGEGPAISPVTIFGMAGMLVGSIIIIDSHKFIGRAGVGIGGRGVTIKYVL